ncbi:hypothetical protein Tco_0233520 [Tanacetum coccineum]
MPSERRLARLSEGYGRWSIRWNYHGTKGRALTDVAMYNPSAEADYMSALQRLQSVNFSLIAELRSNKDASIKTIMNLLCLEDTLAERLGLTKSQPLVDQLMVPIHHSPDQRVVDNYVGLHADGQEGASADVDPFPNVDDAELNIS